MEVTMPIEYGMQGGPSDIRRIPPLEFLLLRERIVREARIARAAAIRDAVGRTFTAALRGARLLSSIVHDAFASRDLHHAGARTLPNLPSRSVTTKPRRHRHHV
jgi:hypothetical protein